MLEIEGKVKKWGNSAGIVLPKEFLEKEHIKINQKVKVIITPAKSLRVSDIFGLQKNWKRPTEEIIRDIKKMDSKFFKE